jgi:hypothetical protein
MDKVEIGRPSGQHTLDAAVTGPISTFDSVAEYLQAFLDGKVGCAFPSQYIGPGDKFIVRPDGTRAFTPDGAQAFFNRNFAPNHPRAETRIIAIPIAPAPESMRDRWRRPERLHLPPYRPPRHRARPSRHRHHRLHHLRRLAATAAPRHHSPCSCTSPRPHSVALSIATSHSS